MSTRLDQALTSKYPDYSRSVIQGFIRDGLAEVNKVIITDKKHKISDRDNLVLHVPKAITPDEINFEVLYEDDDCIVINKPAGVLVHSKGAFNAEATVASWLAPKTKGFETSNRGGIVHRLDRATSGVMICAKTPAALGQLQKQFSLRKVKKTYHALIEKTLEPSEAIIDVPIERNPKQPQRFRVHANGKTAQTSYKIIKTLLYKNKEY